MRILLQLITFLLVSSSITAQRTPTPDQLWGPLFVDVQLTRALGDNKTFVDALPKYSPAIILAKYKVLPLKDSATLSEFVKQNFILPESNDAKPVTTFPPIKQHLQAQWNSLIRKADPKQPHSSLLPLPNSYIVPGGRFREIYYWDSYFTMLGLAASNRYDLIENMLNNFAYLIKTYGHIPNGNRNYYLSRSQPPYFALMVELLANKKGKNIYKKYLPALQKEYAFWMDGSLFTRPGSGFRRIVVMKDGEILNRYHDDSTTPRQESYYEDVQVGLAYQNDDGNVYRHLRSGAESGWDFSSRWFADTFNLTTIETTDIVPVDLNCLLYKYEQILALAYKSVGEVSKSIFIQTKAVARKEAINKYFWNSDQQFYFDYYRSASSHTMRWSLAGVMPLFLKIADPKQGASVSGHVSKKFLKPGGVATTLYNTGQQWDAPNGWAPLQYVTIKGLLNYNFNSLADTIARRWMRVNENVYKRTGKMMEKYNVEDINLISGGGEYPTQDGFGWTNGVYLELDRLFSRNK